MKSIPCSIKVLVLSLLGVVALASAFAPANPGADEPLVVRTMADGGPIAKISWMPDEVSNGTWVLIDGSESNDTDGGWIGNYTWEITHHNVTTYLYAKAQTFKFKELGLYRIRLVVMDNESKTDEDFTAVVSVIDSDNDSLPDWWEIRYFYSLNEVASGDYDNDGYNNLEEFAAGTDPTHKDPKQGLVHLLIANWIYVVILAAAIVGAVIALTPVLKKKRHESEKKKIEFAIAIEKALEGEEEKKK